MPVHAYTIRVGTTSKMFLLHARDPVGATPGHAGLSPSTPGATAAYLREGQAGPVTVPMTPAELGRWSPGGLVEVDPERMPGVYQFGAPDEMFVPGSTRAILMLTFPEAVIDPVEIDLVAFDPQDSVRLGLTALGPEARIEALRGAFPRIAGKELEAITSRGAER
jgi:hypothetical protein